MSETFFHCRCLMCYHLVLQNFLALPVGDFFGVHILKVFSEIQLPPSIIYTLAPIVQCRIRQLWLSGKLLQVCKVLQNCLALFPMA